MSLRSRLGIALLVQGWLQASGIKPRTFIWELNPITAREPCSPSNIWLGLRDASLRFPTNFSLSLSLATAGISHLFPLACIPPKTHTDVTTIKIKTAYVAFWLRRHHSTLSSVQRFEQWRLWDRCTRPGTSVGVSNQHVITGGGEGCGCWLGLLDAKLGNLHTKMSGSLSRALWLAESMGNGRPKEGEFRSELEENHRNQNVPTVDAHGRSNST